MSSILKNLKKNSEKQLKATEERMDSYKSKSVSYKDDRYWKPLLDKNGTGSAIIRFLPGPQIEGTDDQEPTSVRKWSHGFKDPNTGLWYIENNRNSLSTDDHNEPDPCTDYNSKLWNSKDDDLVKQARRQKRKLSYISNVYIVKHPSRPEDEGKVFLFQYGQKIFDKIEAQFNPPEDDIAKIDVFNLWEGANFRLRVKKVEGFPNYDASSFDAPSVLGSDEELEAIFGAEYSLLAEIAPDKFKSYDDLRKRLWEVLGIKDDEVADKATPPWEEQKERQTATAASLPQDDQVVDEPTEEKKPLAESAGAAFFAKLAAKKTA